MPTLTEQLEKEISALEAKVGSDSPFVKQLKEQLRASKENGAQSTQDVYRLQATEFKPSEEKLPSEPRREQFPTTAEYEEALGGWRSHAGRIRAMAAEKPTEA